MADVHDCTFDTRPCRCGPGKTLLLIEPPDQFHCGHCTEHLGLSDLVGLHLTCVSGVVVIRSLRLDVTVHRCGVDELTDIFTDEALDVLSGVLV